MSPRTIDAEKVFEPTAVVAGGQDQADDTAADDGPAERPIESQSLQHVDNARRDIRKASYFAVAGCVSDLEILSSGLCHTKLTCS